MTLLDFLAESITQVSFFLLAVFITPRHVKVPEPRALDAHGVRRRCPRLGHSMPKGWGGGKKKSASRCICNYNCLRFVLLSFSEKLSLCMCPQITS